MCRVAKRRALAPRRRASDGSRSSPFTAAANSGRTALLVAAMVGAPDLLMAATGDLLHQEYRRPAMPATLDLVASLRGDRIAAVVSGAGPTVLALVLATDVEVVARRTPPGWVCLAPAVGVEGATVLPG